MERNEKNSERDLSFLLRAAAAWLLSAAVLLPAAAAVITLADLKASSFPVFGAATGFLCALSAGYSAKKKSDMPVWMLSGAVALSMLILLLTTGFLVSDGKLGAGGILPVAVETIAGCLLGAVLGGKAKKLQKPRIRKGMKRGVRVT